MSQFELLKEGKQIVLRYPVWSSNSDHESVVGYYKGYAVIICEENCDRCKKRFFCYTNKREGV